MSCFCHYAIEDASLPTPWFHETISGIDWKEQNATGWYFGRTRRWFAECRFRNPIGLWCKWSRPIEFEPYLEQRRHVLDIFTYMLAFYHQSLSWRFEREAVISFNLFQDSCVRRNRRTCSTCPLHTIYGCVLQPRNILGHAKGCIRVQQWRTEGGGLGCSNPPPRNSEVIGEVLDRVSKKNRRLDFLL